MKKGSAFGKASPSGKGRSTVLITYYPQETNLKKK